MLFQGWSGAVGAKLALLPRPGGKKQECKAAPPHNPAIPVSCVGLFAFKPSAAPWCAAGKLNFEVSPPCPDTPEHCRGRFHVFEPVQSL